MGIVQQILIGSAPLLLVAIIIGIVKKKVVLPSVLVAVQVAVCIIVGVNFHTKAPRRWANDISSVNMYQIYTDMLKGNLNSATNKLNDLMQTTSDEEDATVMNARLRVMKGQWDEAYALYVKAKEKYSELLTDDEKEFIIKVQNGDILLPENLSYELSNIEYIEEQGFDPAEYGFEEISEEQARENIEYLNEFQSEVMPEIVEKITEQMLAENGLLKDITSIDALVDLIMAYDYNTYDGYGVTKVRNDYLSVDVSVDMLANRDDELKVSKKVSDLLLQELNYYDAEECEAYFDNIYELMADYRDKYPELFEQSRYLEAYIMAVVQSGNYLDEIAKGGNAKALQTLLDMYMGGIITEDNFSDAFAGDAKEKYQRVVERLEQIRAELGMKTDSDIWGEFTQTEVPEDYEEVTIEGVPIDEIIDDIESRTNFAFVEILDDLEEAVEEGEVEEDALCDTYLTLAVANAQNGETEDSVTYFEEAVMNSESSSEDVLQNAFEQIKEAFEEGMQETNYIEMSEDVADAYGEQYYYEVMTDKLREDVESTTGTAVSQIIAKISITRINTDNFPEIQASVVYIGEKELSEMPLHMTDCGIEITDYTIERVEYDEARVVLLCDISGSMANSYMALRDAVIKYVTEMDPKEKVCIVTFGDYIDASSGFTSDKAALVEFANTYIRAELGTEIAVSTESVLDSFSEPAMLNTLIVMTDGEDNHVMSDQDIVTRLGGKARRNNVTIYTIGLGSNLYPDYLTKIANAGGGNFIYCADTGALEDAYEFIHKRTGCEYRITFEAEDLDSTSRLYSIDVLDDKATVPARDSRTYYLTDGEQEITEDTVSNVLPEDVRIDGLSVNRINKSDTVQMVDILGKGFSNYSNFAVTLESKDGSTVHCKVKDTDDGKITFQVAPGVEEGNYSVYLSIQGNRYKVDRLVIGADTPNEIVFGAYTFKANTIDSTAERTILRGSVSMNDYLYFNGEVELRGNVNRDSSVILYTNYPAYVHHDVNNYDMVDRLLLPTNTSTMAFDDIEVELHDDVAHYNDYANYETSMPLESELATLKLGFVSFEGNHMRIYPDRVQIHSGIGWLKDNQITDFLMNGVEFFKVENGMPYARFEIEAESNLRKEGPFALFDATVEAGVGDDDDEFGLEIMDYVSIEAHAKVHVKVDTYNREFALGFEFDTKNSLADGEREKGVMTNGTAGLEVSLHGDEDNPRYSDRYLDISVALPLELTFYIEGIPLTITDMKAELTNFNISGFLRSISSVSGLADSLKGYLTNKEGADLKVQGNVELLSTAALPDGLQETVKKWFGDDVSLVALEDVYGSVGIGYPHIAAGADATLLGAINLAHMELELGAIQYPDFVQAMVNDTEKHYGVRLLMKKGPNFDWDVVGAGLTGTAHVFFMVDTLRAGISVKAEGNISGDVNIWGFKLKAEAGASASASFSVWYDRRIRARVCIECAAEASADIKLFGFNIIDRSVHVEETLIDEEY